MARKTYSPEFRRQAVDLYRSAPGATLRGIAGDLGVSRHILQVWVHARVPEATPTPGLEGRTGSPTEAASARGRMRAGSADAELAALQARVAALETEDAQLLTEQAKLATERDILRQAAKYFAGRRAGEPLPVRR
jgi:transposase